jgi:hypothetical protein
MHTNKFSLSKSWHDWLWNMTPWQEQIVNFRRTHRRVILLHYTTCLATFLAILLRHKLHAKLQGVSCLAINKSRNVFVATTIARVESGSTFCNDCGNVATHF